MSKTHEIRDPIHVFVRLDSDERAVVSSRPFQRLREIHQLAMTYLVYPGATHRRFEHSLGVMELASRIFDVVMLKDHLYFGSVKRIIRDSEYWRRVLRIAALFHDVGHLPFSHAAEKDLLPKDWTHETLSLNIIRSEEMAGVWKQLDVNPDDVSKLALGPKDYPDASKLSDWETVLAEIIVGDVFGADRIDYLQRDSYHAGVAYGRFDHHRLIDTVRILPNAVDGSEEPALGIEQGGLQSAEALLWARYFMFTQLYLHPVRRIYDIHLKEFLQRTLVGGVYPTGIEGHLMNTDSNVLSSIRIAASDAGRPGHDPARRIMRREHFKVVYEPTPSDITRSLKASEYVTAALCKQYGAASVRRDYAPQKSEGRKNFPVFARGGHIQNSTAMSGTLNQVPTFSVDYVFIDPLLRDDAAKWINANRDTIIPVEKPAAE